MEARVHAHKLHKDEETRDTLYPKYKRKVAIVQEVHQHRPYRGTSLIRNSAHPLGPP